MLSRCSLVPMERLADVEELLDGTLDDPDVLRGNLVDLRRINRLLGGVRLSRLAIDGLTNGATELSILDVGTGGADIPVALLADARRRGRGLRVVAIEPRAEVIAAAIASRPGLDRIAGLALELADGLALPYADGSFDVAHCSMVVHHFAPAEAASLLGEMARVARSGIVVNDLVRSRPALLWARLMTNLLTRNRYTRNDAPLSVRRAYTRQEMLGLLAEAGLRPVAQFGDLFGHRYAIAAVRR